MPRGQRPVLAALVELVRRGAHADAGDERVRPGPGVGAAGMCADGQVADDADAHAGLPGRALRRGGLLRRQPLQPGVEVHPVGPRPPQRRHRRGARIGERGRPGPPVRAVHLRDRAPGRPVADRLPIAGPERVELRLALRAEPCPADDLQRRALGRPDRVPVDQGCRPAGGAQRGAEGFDPGPVIRAEPGVLGDVLDAQVERGQVTPGHGQVGRRADRGHRLGRVQRVDQHEVRTKRPAAPGGQVSQVAQIAVAPGAARAHRVQLHREAPGPAARERCHHPGHWRLRGGRASLVLQRVEHRRERLVADLDAAPPPVVV